MDSTPSTQASLDESSFSIRTVGLSKVYNQRRSVDNLSLNIRTGELYALLGDNGAGKTTTINMLTTLVPPTSGEFYICGFRGGKDTESIKSSFGIVSQDVSIYKELTAYENLKFIADLYGIPDQVADGRIYDLLKDNGLLERANDPAGEFSGGMQRKLSIAGALLTEPLVLFMDEPTVGLDPGSRRQIWQSLTNLKEKNVTILLTTHYLEEAEILADRIGIIREGKLVVEGTINELRYKIRGIRGVAIRLADKKAMAQAKDRVDSIRKQFQTEVRFDTLRNTMYLNQPNDTEMVSSLRSVLDWLQEEEINFSRLSTSEPTLEEVFLAISSKEGSFEVDEHGQEMVGG